MAIKPASRKAKGRRLQKWVAKQISRVTGIPYGKDRDIEPREMGQSGMDVKLYGKARELFPWATECKYQENWSVHQWIKQAAENQAVGMDWLLVCRRNYTDPIVMLDAKVFFNLIERLLNEEKKAPQQ
jgi:hypothetical protein